MVGDTVNTVVNHGTTVFVLSTMLAVGLDLSIGQLREAIERHHLMTKSLLVNLVVVLILAYLLVRTIPMAPSYAAGIVLLAVAPGAPFGPKFAWIVTYLVGVAEKEPSEFLVEQGLLVGTTEFFAKSHVFKRVYEQGQHPFGWMQDGVFELFEQEGRLYRWQTEEELVDVTKELP